MPSREDYVLGTGKSEIERLGIQHAAWREQTQAAWSAAGLRQGMRVLDLGCGPGFAALELAERIGATGTLLGVEGAAGFAAHARDLLAPSPARCTIVEADIDCLDLAPGSADFIWCRWVASFVTQPRRLVRQIACALDAGGTAVFHEYLDYGTWRLLPRVEDFEVLVAAIMQSWREHGGEPDIALELPRWLEEEGLSVKVRPLLFVAAPGEPMWTWPATFVEASLARLEALGTIDSQEAARLGRAWNVAREAPGVRMVTPCVAQIIARRA